MGWDAFAYELPLSEAGEPAIRSHEIVRAFEEAADNVKQIAGGADMMLSQGALHLWDAYEMLERATGLTPYDRIWSPDDVDAIFDASDWEFEIPADYEIGYWSALRFMEICAKYKLAIKFC